MYGDSVIVSDGHTLKKGDIVWTRGSDDLAYFAIVKKINGKHLTLRKLYWFDTIRIRIQVWILEAYPFLARIPEEYM